MYESEPQGNKIESYFQLVNLEFQKRIASYLFDITTEQAIMIYHVINHLTYTDKTYPKFYAFLRHLTYWRQGIAYLCHVVMATRVH